MFIDFWAFRKKQRHIMKLTVEVLTEHMDDDKIFLDYLDGCCELMFTLDGKRQRILFEVKSTDDDKTIKCIILNTFMEKLLKEAV